MRSIWLVLGASFCGFALTSFGVDVEAQGLAAAVLLATLVLDRRRALVLAGALLGCVAGMRVEAPAQIADHDPSALVQVAAVLEEPVIDGRTRGWVRLPDVGPLRARVSGLGDITGGAGTRIVGLARLRDLERRPTPDRRAAGRGAAAKRDRIGIVFRDAHVVERGPGGLRDRWSRSLDTRLGGSAGLWRALSVADGHALADDARARVQELGMAHLLALSGMHTAIIAAILIWPWRRRGRRALSFVLPVLVAWAILAGAGPSLVRAVGMATWWVVARRLGRRADVADGLAAVALCELALRPELLCGIGWWLSYAATLAVVRAAATFARWPRAVGAIAVSAAAQVATLPWVLDAFGFMNLAAPVTLLLVGPVFALVLTTGLAALVLGAVLPWAAPWTDPLAVASGHLFGLALHVVEPVGRWTVTASGFDGPAWAAMLGAQAVCLWPAAWSARARAAVAIPLVCTAALIGPADHEWVLFDVGQGDAGILRCGNEALVIDTGPHYGEVAPARWTLVDWLARRRLGHVSVVVTHGHLDHSGGLGALLAQGSVGRLVLARADSGLAWADRVREAGLRSGVPVRWVARGDTLRVGHCRIEVRWPPADAADLHSNDRSVVLSWAAGTGRVLSVGDLERAGERGVGPPGEHTWLKVAHHGGDTGTDEDFLHSVRATHALVCCGAGNRYGHPDPALLRRLEDAGVRVHRTDRCGYLRVRWGGPGQDPVLDCGRSGCP